MSSKMSVLLITICSFTGLLQPVLAKPISLEIIQPQVIYGLDSRVESRNYSSPFFRELRHSVAMKVPDYRLNVRDDGSNLADFQKRTLLDSIPDLCAEEKFQNQYALGTCSGFIVNETTLVTAGHCMLSDRDCESSKWVFDFEDTSETITAQNIYSCKSVKYQAFEYAENKIEDYAVIELDRPVKDRPALKFRKFGMPTYGTPLVVIGHPMGLPQKTIDGARVAFLNKDEDDDFLNSLFMRKNYFEADLDSFSGNSGSPVFNKRTGLVEGILIQGFDDLKYDEENACQRSIVLKGGLRNAYEKVMRITKIPGIK